MNTGVDQISQHETLAILYFLAHKTEWLTNRGLAKATELNERTIRHHTKVFHEHGLLEREETFGEGYRYRFAKNCGDKVYLRRLFRAAEAFGFIEAELGEASAG